MEDPPLVVYDRSDPATMALARITGIRYHPEREQPFTVWRRGEVLGFRRRLEEAQALARGRTSGT